MQEQIVNECVALRRRLHRRPEEGWTEFETTYAVVQALKDTGLAIAFGRDVVEPSEALGRNETLVKAALQRAKANGVPEDFLAACQGFTGVVAELDTGREGPTTALRVDMDCVLVTESEAPGHVPAREGFASERPGFMHACGHDSHTALGVGAALWAATHRDRLKGRIRFIFQPAEEGVRGARAMVAAGAADGVDYFLGAHVGCDTPAGHWRVKSDGFLASTKFDIDIEGTPAHAGHAPQDGHSALMAACAAAMMLQGIPRHGEGATRVSVGTLVAGEGRNVIPAHARLQIEVRGETEAVNAYMRDYVYDIFEGVDKAYRVYSSVTKAGEATTIAPCPDFYDLLESVARDVPALKVMPRDTKPAGSEDATLFMRRVVETGGRAGYVLFGCTNNGHHKPDFDMQDTETMPGALAFYEAFLLRLNGR